MHIQKPVLHRFLNHRPQLLRRQESGHKCSRMCPECNKNIYIRVKDGKIVATCNYLASKNMENNRCLGDIDVFQVDGSLYINGQLNTYTITPAY